MHVGTVAAGRIGLAVLRRMHPFDCKLHYCDRHRLPEKVEKELNLTYHPTPEAMYPHLDVLTLNCPLHPETEHMLNKNTLKLLKRGECTLAPCPLSYGRCPFALMSYARAGAYIVNTARGKLVNREDLAEALTSGHIAGYAGDVWFPQPPPKV